MVIVIKGWLEVYLMFFGGEVDLVFFYIILLVYYLIVENDVCFVIVNFSEGYYL